MTARRSAYGQALRRAGGLAAGPVDDDSASATAEPTMAAPRPRSRFEQGCEQGWDGIAFDELPPAAHNDPDVPSPPRGRGSWADDAPVHPSQPSSQTIVALSGPDQAAIGDPRSPASGGPVVEEANSDPHNGSAPSAPPARASARKPALGMPSTADVDLTAVPQGPPPAPTPPLLPHPAPFTAPLADGDHTVPVSAVAAPHHDSPDDTRTAVDFDVVPAEPLPLPPDPGPPTAEAPMAPVPVVVEIGRVEVRIDAGAPVAPSRERRERPRTGPSLEEFLASGTAGTTGRGV